MNTGTEINREPRQPREQGKIMKISDPLCPVSCSRGSRLLPIRNRLGFTLIELMVVITIIGILAGLIVGLAGVAATKKKIALVETEKNKLMTAIDAYHEKLGFYPPDGLPDSYSLAITNLARTNQLMYELTGCTNQLVDNIQVFTAINVTNGTMVFNSDDAKAYFNKGGIANSAQAPNLPQDFYKMNLKTSQYHFYNIAKPYICGLTVPVDLNPGQLNFWYYDSSSTNRHNPDSYDLWAVFSSGKNIVTNGNWPQQ